MSHLQLGEKKKVNEYREHLNEVLKLDRWKRDNECQSFANEVKELFDNED